MLCRSQGSPVPGRADVPSLVATSAGHSGQRGQPAVATAGSGLHGLQRLGGRGQVVSQDGPLGFGKPGVLQEGSHTKVWRVHDRTRDRRDQWRQPGRADDRACSDAGDDRGDIPGIVARVGPRIRGACAHRIRGATFGSAHRLKLLRAGCRVTLVAIHPGSDAIVRPSDGWDVPIGQRRCLNRDGAEPRLSGSCPSTGNIHWSGRHRCHGRGTSRAVSLCVIARATSTVSTPAMPSSR